MAHGSLGKEFAWANPVTSKSPLEFLHTERQRDREIERQRDRETARQRDRETERQRDRETERVPPGSVPKMYFKPAPGNNFK